MNQLNQYLKNARQQSNLKIREVASETGIDQALISKYESGARIPSEEHIALLSRMYKEDTYTLRTLWLAERVLGLIGDEQVAGAVLAVAESRIEYLHSKKSLELPAFSKKLEKKLENIDALKSEWQNKKPLNTTQLEKMREFFKIEYTYESNRIEGNTLTLQETNLVINEGLTISGKSMKEHLEAVNHGEAVDFVMELAGGKSPVNRRNLLDLHTLILKSIDRENAGRFRTVPVRISGSSHLPPEPFHLEKLMEDYFLHFKKQEHLLHPVILAADMHERLVSIHPFIDGNGRSARLVMNLILLKNGYTIANLKGDLNSRLAYYSALEKVQVDNEPEVFYHLVADTVETSLKAHLALV